MDFANCEPESDDSEYNPDDDKLEFENDPKYNRLSKKEKYVYEIKHELITKRMEE